MKDELKQSLEESGRGDLVKTFETIQSGYAGTLPNGNIVDRRKFPEAIPIQENQLLNAPKPLEAANQIEIVMPDYYEDDEDCGYCGREIGSPHKSGCRQ